MESINQLIALTLIGLMASIAISLYFLRGKKPMLSLILCLGGMFGGLLGAMMYLFATGGLAEHPFMAVPSALLAILFDFLLLKYFGVKLEFEKKKKPWLSTMMTTLLVFFVLVAVLVAMTLPSYSITSIMEMDTDIDAQLFEDRAGSTEDMMSVTSYGDYNSDILQITGVDIGGTDFPRILADPNVGQYCSFTAHFAVTTNPWVKPYVKVGIFHDVNNNGVLDSGDAVLTDAISKVAIGGSEDANWRANCLYAFASPYAPVQQLGVVGIGSPPVALFMPIFHATAWGTVWQNDNGKVFPGNTPEGYTAPRDMISWQYTDASGGSVTLKEAASITFAQVNTGSSSDLSGKFYCVTEMSGWHCGVLIQAFDANQGTDPFDPNAVPLASFVRAFTVGGGGGGGPTITITIASWTVLGILGGGTLIGAVIVGTKYKSILIRI